LEARTNAKGEVNLENRGGKGENELGTREVTQIKTLRGDGQRNLVWTKKIRKGGEGDEEGPMVKRDAKGALKTFKHEYKKGRTGKFKKKKKVKKLKRIEAGEARRIKKRPPV